MLHAHKVDGLYAVIDGDVKGQKSSIAVLMC